MIGGDDIIIHGEPHPDDWDTIVRFMSYAWPEAILEDAQSGDSSPIRALVSPPHLYKTSSGFRREFFVYKNEASLHSWEESGATDDNGDDMIHFLIGAQTITCVVGSLTSPSAALVRDLCASIESKRWSLSQVPEGWGRRAA